MKTKRLIDSNDIKQFQLEGKKILILDVSPKKTVGIKPIEYNKIPVIPNAIKIDLETELCGEDSKLDNSKASPAKILSFINSYGLHLMDYVILYDREGIYSSPRAWLTLQTFNLSNVRVLNGGLQDWLNKGFATAESHAKPTIHDDVNNLPKLSSHESYFCNKQLVFENIALQAYKLIDVRLASRFNGAEKEPRAHLRSGHVPGSINIPFTEFLSERRVLPAKDIKAVLTRHGINPHDKLIFSCGSGVTACIGFLAAKSAGFGAFFVYDGSWQEWGGLQDYPIN